MADSFEIEASLQEAISGFKARTPYLGDVRNANEHFDDYLRQKGKTKAVDSRGMGVLKIEANGRTFLRQGTVILERITPTYAGRKAWKIDWLNHEVDLDEATSAADCLY